MGMDVFGVKPTAEVGTYFRRNLWGWRPLADYCRELAPGVTAACENWHTNDGDGLDAAAATALAQELRAAIADGRVAAYIQERAATLNALPDESCKHCEGTGVRTDEIAREHGFHTRRIDDPDHPRHGQSGWCNGCDGRGAVRPFSTWYSLELSDIEEFAAFLEACGGFEIH